jgi:ATP-dependent helicase/nuclease subunit B
VQATFLLGPAGSGKTHRCLAEIRAELLKSPEGLPLVLLAPKQATFQLERQLLADPSLPGYTRLQILSFERLAQFILSELQADSPEFLSEEGRVMVLRALLIQRQNELNIFRASARLTGFAQQLSLLLREFQRHQLSAAQLDELAGRPETPRQFRDKLHDLSLLLRGYLEWLKAHNLQDANHRLDVATGAIRSCSSSGAGPLSLAGLWLDGFAEMTPQELDLLASLIPRCARVTLAFCLEHGTQAESSWLSTWSVVAQTFRRCYTRIAEIDGCNALVETLANEPDKSRFATSELLRDLESNWSRPAVGPQTAARRAQSSSALHLVQCANPEGEAILAAREILRHVRAGGRFRDCAVIVRQLEPYPVVLSRAFRRYEIPFFIDRLESVSHHPLAELTRFAFRTVAFNWRQEDWFGALKSGLAGAREDEVDVLENEALSRGWQGKTWREPLSIARNEAHAVRLEELRRRLILPFEELHAALADTSFGPNGQQLATALREFWKRLNVEEALDQWSQPAAGDPAFAIRHSSIHSTVLDQMHDWLDNLSRAFPTESLPLRDWMPILEAGLANLTVGVVPPALDEVLIGAVDRSRNPQLKLALVLGLNEGVFPEPPAPGALLTDDDRDRLEAQGVYLGPTKYQSLGHERYLGYIACTRASQRLVLTCAGQDSAGQPLNPSPFFDHAGRITGVKVEKFNGAANWWESEHACELTPHALRANAPPELSQIPAIAPVAGKWKQIQQAAATVNLSTAIVERLFGRELKSSVSALENFAACPFKFFASRGLRLEERKKFQFDDRDRGGFQHEVLSEFHRRVAASGRQWRDLTPLEAGDLAARIGRDLLPLFGDGKFLADGASRFTGEIMVERLRQLVSALIEWMPQYDFNPVVCEAAFGEENDALPFWRLELDNGRALLLRGRIDRVDLCKVDDGTALAVVMDYKSRAQKLDTTKLHHGLELQLLSYLGVLKHLRSPEKIFGAKQLTPAGVFYVPLKGDGKSGASRQDVVRADSDECRTEYQHSGRFLGDELEHFDNRNRPKGGQFKYSKNKDGSFSKRGNDAMQKPEFEGLREEIEDHLRDYGRRIFAGEVLVSPFRIGNATACDYCEFRAVCRFDPWTQPFRHLRPPPREHDRDKAGTT